MRALRLALVAAAAAASLVPASASACQWEVYERPYTTPAGTFTVPMAHCVSP